MFFPRQWRVEDFLTSVMTSCHDQLPLRKGIDAMNRILVRGVPPPKESKGPGFGLWQFSTAFRDQLLEVCWIFTHPLHERGHLLRVGFMQDSVRRRLWVGQGGNWPGIEWAPGDRFECFHHGGTRSFMEDRVRLHHKCFLRQWSHHVTSPRRIKFLATRQE